MKTIALVLMVGCIPPSSGSGASTMPRPVGSPPPGAPYAGGAAPVSATVSASGNATEPPQGSLAADGSLQLPGGPLGEVPRDCGPAANHCLRSNWFITGMAARPVFKVGEDWYQFDGEKPTGGTLWLTTPATAANLQRMKTAIVYDPLPPPDEDTAVFPANDKEAQTSPRWHTHVVDEIDLAAGVIRVGIPARVYRIDTVRVLSNPIAL